MPSGRRKINASIALLRAASEIGAAGFHCESAPKKSRFAAPRCDFATTLGPGEAFFDAFTVFFHAAEPYFLCLIFHPCYYLRQSNAAPAAVRGHPENALLSGSWQFATSKTPLYRCVILRCTTTNQDAFGLGSFQRGTFFVNKINALKQNTRRSE
ncbi:MAG TPA: hypothetical protein VKN76_02290 [Kiloniellaceae bacterium]|nr:hypothetical protein [Kiloniellaceae bacterium]